MVRKVFMLFFVFNLLCLSLSAVPVDSLSQMPVRTDSVNKIKNQNLMRLIDREELTVPESTQKMMDAAARMNFEKMKADSLRERALLNPLFMPVVFRGVVHPGKIVPQRVERTKTDEILNINLTADRWLYDQMAVDSLHDDLRYAVVMKVPESVRYSIFSLPVVPVVGTIETNPLKDLLKVETVTPVTVDKLATGVPKVKPWLTKMQSSVQFSQIHISDNWYQGGQSNLNLVNFQNFNVAYMGNKKIEFSTNILWKTGLSSTQTGAVRPLQINEDLFQVESKFGLRAVEHWYYALNMQFKTQFFNGYKNETSMERVASFLSPGELNVGVGMNYDLKKPAHKFEMSVSLSPLSYNLTMVLDTAHVDAARFGVKKGDRLLQELGSSVKGNMKWEFFRNMIWNMRLFYFTSYDKVQMEFENNFDFVLNRFFSTRLSLNLRYDDGKVRPNVSDWEFREMLSFGFNYRW